MQALEEALAPRMSLLGESAVLDDFKACFDDTLKAGSRVLLLWDSNAGTLDVCSLPSGAPVDLGNVRRPPEMCVQRCA